MRIPKKYGERTAHFDKIQNEKRKYILAFEGHETEVQYFSGVSDNRNEIGIDPIIQILPLYRSVLYLTHSHPKHVFNLLSEHLEEYNSVKVLIDKIVDYAVDISNSEFDYFYSKNKFYDDLKVFFTDILKFKLDSQITVDMDLLEHLTNFLRNHIDFTGQIENISYYLEHQQVLYSPGYDNVCIIVDRDKNNFKEKQYHNLVDECIKQNYRLFVTNPAFEFWLLLHSDKVFEYDRTFLFRNIKNGKKRYLETALSQTFAGYRKDCIKFDRFLPYIRKAIANEKLFCEDIVILIDELGSNLGILLAEMLNNETKA